MMLADQKLNCSSISLSGITFASFARLDSNKFLGKAAQSPNKLSFDSSFQLFPNGAFR